MSDVRRSERPAALHPVPAIAALALTLLLPTVASAQSAIAPYFMFLLDNSGSMTSATGTGNNSCGVPRTRLNDAKCVMQQVINGFGEASWGLGAFRVTCTGGTGTSPCYSGNCGCTGCTYQCLSTATVGNPLDGQILVPIAPDNQADLLSWVNYQNSVCTGITGLGHELLTTGSTPITGTLLAARDYFAGATSPLIGDAATASGCRPVYVIMLTDGANTCGAAPNTVATALRTTAVPAGGGIAAYTANIRTFAIGFGVAAGNAQIEAIAMAGGTDAPGVNRGFYATDETSLSLAFSQIVADSIRYETCDNVDNDCDTRVDEGFARYCHTGQTCCAWTTPAQRTTCLTNFRATVTPANPSGNTALLPCTTPAQATASSTWLCDQPLESCDSVDNDCDGTVDEGATRNACGGCGPVPAEVCNRIDDNCNGTIDEGVCGSCVPSGPEVCNGVDDDCDGSIDGVVRACGTDVGLCTAGTQLCTAGVWGTCSGVGEGTEVCNNLDDDCDGLVDGFAQPCGSDTGECQAGSQLCTAGALGACLGAIGPATDTCNGLDDDCDGTVDEGNPGGGASCGTATGECAPGVVQCVAGALTCVGGVSGSAETCNTSDDDCDGRVDEGNPGGGASCGATDVGACAFGAITCTMGALTCVGAVGPAAERCNTLDDDCDALVDEGNPEAGASCGDDTGACQRGVTSCVGGAVRCEGAVGPAEETCNGIDDDCDGAVDDGIAVGAACGTDVGECSPGVTVCDPSTGTTRCEGEVGPGAEACNLLDDDCDGVVDNGLGDGSACGSEEGVCAPGVRRCVEGAVVCVGEIPAGTEVCDCEDNDCDGAVDETGTGSLACPGSTACVSCQCASECMMGEFGRECAGGRVPQEVGGTCYCVAPRCDEAACGAETLTFDGGVLCAPGSDEVAPCTCRNNTCSFSCDGVTCPSGLVCDPGDPDGRCVEDSCVGLGCPGGELCDRATGACMPDPCAGVTCAAGEACRAGTCEASCATVTCGASERCQAGTCVPDPCAGVACPAGEACDPTTGGCVVDACEGVTCPAGTECSVVSGACVEVACTGVRCPMGEVCEDGECAPGTGRPDAGMIGIDGGGLDAGVGRSETRVIATGGGLCAVGVPGRGPGAGLLGVPLGLLMLALARRRNRVSGGGL